MELARITNSPEVPSEVFTLAQPNNRRAEIVHAIMRGRYRWAVLLGAVLAVPATWIGYKLGKPTYRSDVPIRVELTEHRVLYNDEEKGALPRYEGFVATQISLIKSQRVIDLAMQDPGWTQLRKTDAPDATLEFVNNLDVDRKDELITVSYNDPQPQIAMAGAEAVVKAYRKLYLEDDAAKETRRLEILQQLETALSNDLESKTQRLASVTASYGVHDIRRITDGKYEELHKLIMKLGDLQLQLALMAPTTHPDTGAPQGDPQTWTAEDFAYDRFLGSALEQRTRLEEQLASYRARGFGDSNNVVKSATLQLAYTENLIQERTELLRKAPQRAVVYADRYVDPSVTADVGVLTQQISTVKAMKERAEKDYKDLDQIAAQTDDLRSQMDDIKKRLEDTRSRIEQLNVESSMSGRITFPTNAVGERPLAPFKDSRLKFAVAGGGGAGLLGFGLVLAFTLLDRRVRNADEVRVRLSVGHLLGRLPALPQDMSDLDQAAAAAHSVHEIRSMLQIRATNPNPCFAVTSPMSGSGKTSLSMALAFSFASSGAKTLLIDCDLVGGGLTKRLQAIARTRIGQMLRSKGLLTAAQLRDALRTSKSQGKQIGQVLIDEGLATQTEIDACIGTQATMSHGLVDALHGEPLMNCVTPSAFEGCFVLPIGHATALHAASLSPSSVKRIIEAARRHFDVVIVDSGPIPGSLEAAAVAAVADGVVMLVSRGEPRSAVEECISRLRDIGAPLAGVVLNRVSHGEMQPYSGSNSYASGDSSKPSSLGSPANEVPFAGNVGPIARAVIRSAPTASNN